MVGSWALRFGLLFVKIFVSSEHPIVYFLLFCFWKNLASLLEKKDITLKYMLNITCLDRILILETQLGIFLIMLASNIFTVKLFSWTLSNNILRKLKYYSKRKIVEKFMTSVKFHIFLLDILQEFKF